MRKFNRKSAAIAVAVFLAAAFCANGDTAVILGAGNIGTWTTTGYAANPNGSTEFLTVSNVPFPCSPPMACPLNPVMIPSLGSASLTSFLTGTFGTFYVTQQESTPPPFPIVRASLVSATPLTRAVDIPVVTLSRLMAATASILNFGGIASEPPPPCAFGIPCFARHSTLVLGNIQRTPTAPVEDLPVLLELFDSNGNPAGSASLTVPYGQTILIGDVGVYVGNGMFTGELGQLRITRVSGGALMWGIVYSTNIDGSVTACAGANLNLSP
jgi:hypothetical protein